MAFNPKDYSYKITGFDSQNNPIVLFNCNGKSQVLGSCPTDNAESAQAYIDEYVIAYINGLLSQVPDSVDKSVTALVGTVITPDLTDLVV